MNNSPITIETIVNAPIEKVWEYWTKPEHIEKWAFASDDWEATDATNDLRTGGTFSTTMGAKDKSESFDFGGTYTNVVASQTIEYDMSVDENETKARHVRIDFSTTPEGTKIVQTFEPEQENSEDLQREGWQAILDNFKKHVESN